MTEQQYRTGEQLLHKTQPLSIIQLFQWCSNDISYSTFDMKYRRDYPKINTLKLHTVSA